MILHIYSTFTHVTDIYSSRLWRNWMSHVTDIYSSRHLLGTFTRVVCHAIGWVMSQTFIFCWHLLGTFTRVVCHAIGWVMSQTFTRDIYSSRLWHDSSNCVTIAQAPELEVVLTWLISVRHRIICDMLINICSSHDVSLLCKMSLYYRTHMYIKQHLLCEISGGERLHESHHRVAKTHRMPYLYSSFSTKDP